MKLLYYDQAYFLSLQSCTIKAPSTFILHKKKMQAHLFENQIDYRQKSILKLYQDWNWNWETFNSLVIDVAVILNVQFLKMFLVNIISVAYRYRKSISIIELFVSIISIYRVLGN